MKSKQEFILDTLRGYFVNPETCSIDKDKKYKCLYLAPNGNKCAVGQYIKDYDPKMETFEKGLEDIIKNLTDEAKAQNITYTEWLNIQQVHDTLAKYMFDPQDSETLGNVSRAIRGCSSICNVNLSELETLIPTKTLSV